MHFYDCRRWQGRKWLKAPGARLATDVPECLQGMEGTSRASCTQTLPRYMNGWSSPTVWPFDLIRTTAKGLHIIKETDMYTHAYT